MNKIEIAIKFCKYYVINKTQLKIKFIFLLGQIWFNVFSFGPNPVRSELYIIVHVNSGVKLHCGGVQWRVSLSTTRVRMFVENSWELFSTYLYFFKIYMSSLYTINCILKKPNRLCLCLASNMNTTS
jgi:hypothetical protein